MGLPGVFKYPYIQGVMTRYDPVVIANTLWKPSSFFQVNGKPYGSVMGSTASNPKESKTLSSVGLMVETSYPQVIGLFQGKNSEILP